MDNRRLTLYVLEQCLEGQLNFFFSLCNSAVTDKFFTSRCSTTIHSNRTRTTMYMHSIDLVKCLTAGHKTNVMSVTVQWCCLQNEIAAICGYL